LRPPVSSPSAVVPPASGRWPDGVRPGVGPSPADREAIFQCYFHIFPWNELPPDPIGDFYQGGTFCSMEFDGDRSRIID